MARTKRGVVSRAKHNKVLKSVKGQRGRRKNTIELLVKQWKKRCNMLTEIEKQKKENLDLYGYKELMLELELKGLTYAKFINGLAKSKIKLDRKVLAELAYNNPEVFKSVVKKVQSSLA